ncbi:MAG: DUF6055 domain-containing protein [Armatimonadetes bacterium]|nr:DUF6055 domain-containing protein [Armatimonadota bacterium]
MSKDVYLPVEWIEGVTIMNKRAAFKFLVSLIVSTACIVCPAVAGAQAYLDNQTETSNQDPNTETRRSDHFRINFGQYNFDGTYLSEELAQGNLQLFEQLWQRNIVENGLNEMSQSSDLTKRDGNKYRTNFNFLMTWGDGGGGAYMSSDANGFAYAMASPGYTRVDPPSSATTHELGHVWEGAARGFNGGVSGMWWECTANWFALQLLNSYPFPGGAVWNQPFYYTHGRDFYDSWIIYEAFREDPRYGMPFINQVWTNANADQQAHEYIINRMARLDSSGSADKDGASRDLWGDMAKKCVTWDYERKRWFAGGTDDGSDWWYCFGMRAPMVKLPGNTGWYRPERIYNPMQYGFNIIQLTASPNTTVSCNFQPVCDPVRQSDWRACLVAVSNVGDVRDITKNIARYSSLWNKGTNSIKLSSDETKLYLVVVATPRPMVVGVWNEYRLDSGLQFPYTVSFANATPKNVVYPAYTGTHTHHANGGGLVASGATVAATAYVGPNAQVLGTAQVNGYARIEDYAVVGSGAIVEDNAVVSGHAFVWDTAHIYGNAKVRDFGYVAGNAQVFENARVIEHGLFYDSASGCAVVKGRSYIYSPSVLTGSLITDGDSSNGNGDPADWGVVADHGVHFGWQWGHNPSIFTGLTDNNYIYEQHTFERENPVFAWDEYGINQGFLMNGCRAAKDTIAPTRGGLALPLDGSSQYVELHNTVNDWRETAYTVWVKWTGSAADQRIWSMGDGANKYMYLTPKDGTTGNLRFVISNGTTTQYLNGASPISANTWTHVAVTFGSPVFNTTTKTWSGTGTLYVNGAQVATLAGMLVPDSLNAANMENCNYLGRGNAGNYFQGYLDDFRGYMKSLDAAEVLAVYNTAAPAPVTITADTTAPTPNAETWLVAPNAVSDSAITMSATLGADASGWVEYYFTCTAGGHDSGWVSFNKYTDVGLNPGVSYTYTVKMRDKNGNTTAASSPASATTQVSSMTGVTASFAYGPVGIAGTSASNGQIKMTATKLTSPSGLVEYKFDRYTISGALSLAGAWQANPTFIVTGLNYTTTYYYRVTARDGWGNTSVQSASSSTPARDLAAPILTVPVAHWNMLPYATINNGVSMRAVGVQESGCSFYYQCVSGGGPDSGWIAAPILDTWDNSYPANFTTAALPDGTYGYRYKMRDAAGNESGWSTTAYAKITPTTGYHSATLSQLATLPDDNLVSFSGTVLRVNAKDYYVKDMASGASITVKPNKGGGWTPPPAVGADPGATDAILALKNVTVKGHLYTIGGVRQVTYATVLSAGAAQTCNVTGRVTRQSDGAPILGATVYLSDAANPSANPIITAVTDRNGNYAVAMINGTWYVAAGASVYNTSADQVITVNGANVPNVNFSLVASTMISGKVTNSAGGGNIAGASVYFSTSPNASNVIFTATTDSSGNYSQPVQNGTWYVRASAVGFSVSADKTVNVSGSNVTGINHALTVAAPVAWYKFDETSGLSASDSSGNGKNGTLTGGGCTWGAGNLNNAVSLDGVSPTGSYVSLPANLMSSMNNFTIATWVNFESASAFNANRRIFDFNAGQGAASIYLSQWGQNGGDGQALHYAIKPSGAGSETAIDYTGSVPLNTWKHVAVTQSGGVLTIYIDGAQVAQQAGMPSPSSVGNTANDWIGRSQWSSPGWGDPCLDGQVDNFKIYNTCLGADSIRALANEGTAKFSYTITASAGTGGTIDPPGVANVAPSGSQTYTITPNIGYAISQVTVDGVNQGAITSYTFSNVLANHTISAAFIAVNIYTITAFAGTNGTINPSGYVIVNQGASQTFTMTPNDGYCVSGVIVDGSSVGTPTSYAFTNVQANHTMSVTFAVAPRPMLTSKGTGGTRTDGPWTIGYKFTTGPSPVTVSKLGFVDYTGAGLLAAHRVGIWKTSDNSLIASTTVPAGTAGELMGDFRYANLAVPVTLNANTTYVIGAEVFNGGDAWMISAASPGLTSPDFDGFVVVESNYHSGAGLNRPETTWVAGQCAPLCNLVIVPQTITYTITASSGTGGTISPSGAVTVNSGTNQTFNISANSGYAISQVTVDGVNQGAISTYTFTNVQAIHAISASFLKLYGMNSKAALSAMARGHAVRVWGKVTTDNRPTSFTIDDGSGAPVTVNVNGAAIPSGFAVNKTVVVTGVVGLTNMIQAQTVSVY